MFKLYHLKWIASGFLFGLMWASSPMVNATVTRSSNPALPLTVTTEGERWKITVSSKNDTYIEVKAHDRQDEINLYVMAIAREEVLAKKYGNASVESWVLEKRIPMYLKFFAENSPLREERTGTEVILLDDVPVKLFHYRVYINGTSTKRYLSFFLAERNSVVYKGVVNSGSTPIPLKGSGAFKEFMSGIRFE